MKDIIKLIEEGTPLARIPEKEIKKYFNYKEKGLKSKSKSILYNKNQNSKNETNNH